MPGLGLGLTLGGRAGGGAPAETITFIAAGGANATTIAPSGVLAGDLIIGIAAKTTIGVPTHDVTGGALIGSGSSNGSSIIAFWKYAESSTPAFGTHANASRVQWYGYRFSAPPVAPIGAFARASAAASFNFEWAGLTLTKTGSHVITFGHRAADEAIVDRTGVVSVSGSAGVGTRYKPMRSNGSVASWAAENVAQAVSGYHQSIAIELGF